MTNTWTAGPAPGMQSAMAILTVRVQSMDGTCTAGDYVEFLREELADEDPVILVSALASLASALLSVASDGTRIPAEKLLSALGVALAEGRKA